MAASPKKRGFFITFEGGEGSGKSSQINILEKRLKELGEEVITTREPGGSSGGEAVRHVLLSGAAEDLGSEMEAILFFAARSDNIETIIKPALDAGKHVLCDRFFDSTRVYQGASGKANDALLDALEQVICADAWPDLTIIIDIDPEEGLARAAERRGKKAKPDRFEKETLELQEKRRIAYLQLAEKEPERCVVVDGKGTPTQVAARIKKVVQSRLGLLKTAKRKSDSSTRAKRTKKTGRTENTGQNG